jgi:hypothetical protein
MDGDPSQEDRIRLIGRLFFNYIAAMLKEVQIERGSFVNFSQNVIRKSNFLGCIWGQWGQELGQAYVVEQMEIAAERKMLA